MPRPNKTPIGFSSLEEFDVYCNCINKTSIGDMVELCVAKENNIYYVVQNSKLTIEVTIIGKRISKIDKYSTMLLLGTNRQDTCFWNIATSANFRTDRLQYNKDFVKAFSYGYWMSNDAQKIKRIYKYYDNYSLTNQ